MNTRGKHSNPNSLLYDAFLKLKNRDEVYAFLTDLCTVPEMLAMEQRFEVARLLDEGVIYAEIEERTGASSATVSRVNRFLNYGYGAEGYPMVLDRMKDDEE